MFGKCDSGIDLIEENLGKLYNSGTYLLMGETGTGKTTFVLQFLLQALKEGKSCLLVTSTSPRDFVIYTESLEMGLASYITEGRLIIYEYTVDKDFSVKHFFDEIMSVISQNGISRLALDSFIGQNILSGENLPFSDELPTFLENIEKKNVVSFITLELPLPTKMFIIKKKLEVSAVGVFLLKAVSASEKVFVVRKLTGQLASSNKEFRFLIQKGKGIKEIKEAPGLGFNRFFSKKKPLEYEKITLPGKEKSLELGEIIFFSKERPLEFSKIASFRKEKALEFAKITLPQREKAVEEGKINFFSNAKRVETEKITLPQKKAENKNISFNNNI